MESEVKRMIEGKGLGGKRVNRSTQSAYKVVLVNDNCELRYVLSGREDL